MIGEMLRSADLTEAETSRLRELSQWDSFDQYTASGLDGLYQVYLDQGVME